MVFKCWKKYIVLLTRIGQIQLIVGFDRWVDFNMGFRKCDYPFVIYVNSFVAFVKMLKGLVELRLTQAAIIIAELCEANGDVRMCELGTVGGNVFGSKGYGLL